MKRLDKENSRTVFPALSRPRNKILAFCEIIKGDEQCDKTREGSGSRNPPDLVHQTCSSLWREVSAAIPGTAGDGKKIYPSLRVYHRTSYKAT